MLIPAQRQEHARWNDVLLQLRPSLPGLRRKLPSLVRSVHRYYGAVRLLQHVHVRRSVYGLRGPAFADSRRRAGDLPVLVHVASQRAWALRLRRTGPPLAISQRPFCLPPTPSKITSCGSGACSLHRRKSPPADLERAVYTGAGFGGVIWTL